MFKQNYTVFSYVDDLIGCIPVREANKAFQFLLDVLQDLNFLISDKKFMQPTTICNCLGIIVNTENHTISVPEDKIPEIFEKCNNVLSARNITKRQLQSLLGSIMFIHKCVKS